MELNSTEKIVAVMGGGDWCDASIEHLVMSKDVNLSEEEKLYKVWYNEVYCRGLRGERDRVDFMVFSQWLIKKGARETTEDILEEYWED